MGEAAKYKVLFQHMDYMVARKLFSSVIKRIIPTIEEWNNNRIGSGCRISILLDNVITELGYTESQRV